MLSKLKCHLSFLYVQYHLVTSNKVGSSVHICKPWNDSMSHLKMPMGKINSTCVSFCLSLYFFPFSLSLLLSLYVSGFILSRVSPFNCFSAFIFISPCAFDHLLHLFVTSSGPPSLLFPFVRHFQQTFKQNLHKYGSGWLQGAMLFVSFRVI